MLRIVFIIHKKCLFNTLQIGNFLVLSDKFNQQNYTKVNNEDQNLIMNVIIKNAHKTPMF